MSALWLMLLAVLCACAGDDTDEPLGTLAEPTVLLTEEIPIGDPLQADGDPRAEVQTPATEPAEAVGVVLPPGPVAIEGALLAGELSAEELALIEEAAARAAETILQDGPLKGEGLGGVTLPLLMDGVKSLAVAFAGLVASLLAFYLRRWFVPLTTWLGERPTVKTLQAAHAAELADRDKTIADLQALAEKKELQVLALQGQLDQATAPDPPAPERRVPVSAISRPPGFIGTSKDVWTETPA